MGRTTQTAGSKEVSDADEVNPRLPAVEEQPESGPQRGPSYKARFGRVEAAVWSRELEEGRIAYSVTLQRSYRDGDGKWQRTSSLDEGDLLPAAKALDDAYSWIQKTRQQHRQQETSQRDEQFGAALLMRRRSRALARCTAISFAGRKGVSARSSRFRLAKIGKNGKNGKQLGVLVHEKVGSVPARLTY